jgi:hypothetical protein
MYWYTIRPFGLFKLTWYILWPFEIFLWLFGTFFPIFGVLYHEQSGNPASVNNAKVLFVKNVFAAHCLPSIPTYAQIYIRHDKIFQWENFFFFLSPLECLRKFFFQNTFQQQLFHGV